MRYRTISPRKKLFLRVLAVAWLITLVVISGVLFNLSNCVMDNSCTSIHIGDFTIDVTHVSNAISLIVPIILTIHIAHDNFEIFKKLERLLGNRHDHPAANGSNPAEKISREAHLKARRKKFQKHLLMEGHTSFIKMRYQLPDGHQSEDMMQVYREYRRFVITGIPGSGKTRVLKDIYIHLIDAFLDDQEDASMPLWVDLNDENNPIDAAELLQERCQRYGINMAFEQMMENNPPVLLLDGLDEMPPDTRRQRAKSLTKWLEDHPYVEVIITCRVRDYEDDRYLNLGNILPAVRVLPFGKTQIQAYLQAHLRTKMRPGTGRTTLSRSQALHLLRMIEKDDAVLRLAKTPLHLYMLTQLSVWSKAKQQLPRRLRDLYENYIEKLYEYESRKKPLNLDLKALTKTMSRLAYRMTDPESDERAGAYAMREKEVRSMIGERALKDAYNLNLLVQSPGAGKSKRLQFFHKMVHVYFALPILKQAITQQTQQGFWQRLQRHFASQDEELGSLIRRIGDLGDAAEIAVDDLIDNLKDAGTSDEIRKITTHALIDIGIPAIKPLLELLLSKNARIRRSASTILTKIGSPAIGPMILFAAKQKNQTLNEEVATLLISIEGETLRYMADAVLRNNRNDEFRAYVAEYLGELQSSLAIQALEAVIQDLLEMLNDPSPEVRADVALALSKIRDLSTIEPLIEMLKREKGILPRRYATAALKNIGEEAMYMFLLALRQGTKIERKMLLDAFSLLDRDIERRKKVYATITKTPMNESFVRKFASYYAARQT